MSLSDLLEADLRTLSNESKKKTGDLKELVEKTINALRQSDKIPIESIFQVLSCAKSSNTQKIINIALSILQKLLTSQGIGSLIPAVTFLKDTLDEYSDESIQLKVLQTLMLMHDPSTLKIVPDFVTIVWDIYVFSQYSKSNLVKNTASATLRQLISITFHQLRENRNPELIDSAIFLFHHACELVKGKNVETIKFKPEGLALLIEILEACRGYAPEIEKISAFILQDLSTVILNHLTEDSEESIGSKCIQCGMILVEIANSHLDVLRNVLKILENRKVPEWLSTSCLEFVRHSLSLPKVLKAIFEDSELHLKLLDGLSKISHELFAQPEDLRLGHVKVKVRIISEIISHWVDSISIIAEESGLKLGEPNQVTRDSCAEAMVSALWKPILPILSIMVSNSYNESILQTMLNSYQTLINLAGTLNLSSAREALLASLCQFCIPSTTSVLNSKHMHICKTLFNITHCLGFVLDNKAWHKVLDTLYKLDFLLNNSGKVEDPDLSSDISILVSAMESLFKNTTLWPDHTIVDLMSALGQLTLEFMETLATNDKKINGGKVFGIEKMIIVGQNNLNRIELYWESLSAYLDCICNSKYSEIRNLGIGSLSRIILSAFKKFNECPPKSELENWKYWQRTLLLSLHDLLGSAYQDTQESVFKVLFSILSSSGSTIDNSGWSMLLFILSKISMPGVFKEGFKCVQFIVSDFLQSENLLPSLERLITCVSKYARSEDCNQAIGAVGMYWNIADYLGKIGKDKVDLWWIILEELKTLGEDPRIEVRHSALHSLHVAISTHCSLLSETAWQRVIQGIILPLLDRISINYAKNCENLPKIQNSEVPKLEKKNSLVSETNEKKWEETYNIFTQNLGKIFRTYITSLEKYRPEAIQELCVQRNWEILVGKLKEGINAGTLNVLISVLKTVKELLSCNKVSNLFFSKWACSWEIFGTLSEKLASVNFLIQFKLISIVLEVLGLVYSAHFDNQYEDSCLDSVFSILTSLLKSTSQESPLSNAKLLPEQREIWEFIDKLLENLVEHDKNLDSFVEFLIKYLKYDSEDPHSDALCRKALETSELLIVKYKSQCSELFAKVLDEYKKLLYLRFANETFLQTQTTARGASPIWHFAGESLLKIFTAICEDLYWEKFIQILEAILNVPEKVISKISKQNLESLARTSEELDIRIIEALIQTLLSIEAIDAKILGKLISIIDLGCDSFYKAIHAQELVLRRSFTIVCFNGLLTLSKETSKIASISLTFLIHRCKDLLIKFSKEEKLSGQMPLPRVKLLEILEVLNELKKLDICPGSLSKPSKKGHLLEIFPYLCELITVKDQEVKETLKQVFLEISRNM